MFHPRLILACILLVTQPALGQLSQQWVKRYGYTSGADIARAMVLDNSGNIYVTGSSWGGSVDKEDIATIKYDPSGMQQWVKRYGYTNGPDIAYAMVSDDSGNVYVTGSSWGNSIDKEDFITIKYNPSGVQLWAKRYAYSNGPDIAYAIALDGSGNVYVTGSSWDGSVFQEDYATIKYSPAGVEQWVKRYGSGGPDIARAVTTDADGNVYVTGSSWGNSIDKEDMATIKYSPAGVQQWVKRYGYTNGPDMARAITADDSGNVYITGSSWGSFVDKEDFATIKYDPAGVQLWVKRYAYGNGPDIAYAMVSDHAGNVYVTGSSWDGSVFQEDYATIKYSSAGVQQWVKRYGSGGPDIARALTLDDAGGVYVTGSGWEGSVFQEDYATIKYSSAGVQQWIKKYGSSGPDIAGAVAVSGTGSVYVAGSSWGNSIDREDYATVKYCVQPSISLGSPNFSICSGQSVQLSAGGGTGYAWSPATGLNAANIADPVASPAATTSYSVTVSNDEGCSGTATVPVTVNRVWQIDVNASICAGGIYTFPDGATSTTDGINTSHFLSSKGCDSTVTTHLTVNSASSGDLTVTACNQYTAPDGQTRNTSGTYTAVIPNHAGCDSIVTIRLTVLHSTTATISPPPACGSYTAPNGQQISSSGTYTAILRNAVGCDSVITIHLIVYPRYSLSQNAAVCAGGTYIFPDGTSTGTSSVHTSFFSTVNGCDSNIVTALTVRPLPDVSVVSDNGIFSAVQTGAAYRWIDCINGNIIPGATGKNYTPTANGSYAVIITVNTCSDTSGCLEIHHLGIDGNASSFPIGIYPNPTNNLATVDLYKTAATVRVNLLDITGKILAGSKLTDVKYVFLDMRPYPPGIYYVEITADGSRQVLKLVRE